MDGRTRLLPTTAPRRITLRKQLRRSRCSSHNLRSPRWMCRKWTPPPWTPDPSVVFAKPLQCITSRRTSQCPLIPPAQRAQFIETRNHNFKLAVQNGAFPSRSPSAGRGRGLRPFGGNYGFGPVGFGAQGHTVQQPQQYQYPARQLQGRPTVEAIERTPPMSTTAPPPPKG